MNKSGILSERKTRGKVSKEKKPKSKGMKPHTIKIPKRQGFLGVRIKMTAVFLVLVCIMIVMGGLNYTRAKDAIVKTYVKDKEQTFTAMGNYMQLIFDNTAMQSVRILTNEDVVKFYSTTNASDKMIRLDAKKKIDSTITSIVNTDKYINSIMLIVKDDTVICSNPIQLKKTFYDDFAESVEGKSILSAVDGTNCWLGSHPYIDATLNTTTSSYGLSMARNLGNSLSGKEGAVVIDISLSVIEDLLNQLVDKSETMAFITEDGREIFSNGSTVDVVQTDFYKESFIGEKSSGTRYVTINDEKYLYTYCKIGTTNNMLCSLIDQKVIYQSADMIKVTTIMMIIGTSILAMLIATFYSASLSKAIKQVVHGISKVAEGDLTVTMKTKRKDEFGTLTKNVDQMRHNVKKLITNTATVSLEVKDSTLEVSKSSEVIKVSMSAISSAVDEIEQGMVEQADAANDCLNQMNLLAERINEVTLSTDRIGTVESNTKVIMESNYNLLQDLYQKAQGTAQITSKIVGDMDKLSSQSNSITEIISTIEDIASQSSLLSLNASIEAARAGSLGKGFAVVAQEIGKLAQQSLEAAMNVKEIAEGISRQTKESSANVMTAQDTVSEQTVALDKTMKGFAEIEEQIKELMSQIENIKSEIYAIETVKNDTLSSISNISAVSQQTAAATREVCDKTDYELQSVEKLNEVIALLEEKAKNLEEEIGVFKI